MTQMIAKLILNIFNKMSIKDLSLIRNIHALRKIQR